MRVLSLALAAMVVLGGLVARLLAADETAPAKDESRGQTLFRDSFEAPSGAEGWHQVSRWGGKTDAAAWRPDGGRRGGGCLVLTAQGTKVGWERTAVAAVAGATYGIRGWVQGTLSQGQASVGIAFAGRRGEIVSEAFSGPAGESTNWRGVSVSAVAPAEAVVVTFFCCAEGTGQAVFDDIAGSVTLPARLRLVSWDFPRRVSQGEQADVSLKLVASQDISEPPSLAAFVSAAGSEGTILRRFQRLTETGESWRGGEERQVEMPVLTAKDRYPPGKYTLRLELRNAAWADGKTQLEAEFEIVAKASTGAALVLRRATYFGPREVKAGDELRFSVSMTSTGNTPAGRVFAWVLRGDELWAATGFGFPGGGERIRLGDIVLDIPEGMPAGEYELGVGIVGMKYEGKSPQDCSIAKLVVGAGDSEEGTLAARPLAHGAFVDSSMTPHFWWVNQQAMLFWDGEPYAPIGLAYCPAFLREYRPDTEPRNEANWQIFVETLKGMRSSGLGDLLLIPGRPLTEIPAAALQRAVDELEFEGFGYAIEVAGGPMKPLRGYWVNSGMTLRDVAPGADYTSPPAAFPIAEKSEALYLVLDESRQEVLEAGRACLAKEPSLASQGCFIVHLQGQERGGDRVFLAPKIQLDAPSGEQNLWEGFEDSIGELCQALGEVRFGSGLRCLIEPLRPGLSYGFPPLMPDSPQFREEHERWLERRFGTVEALQERWCLSGEELASFAEASTLVPVAVAGDVGFLVSAGSEPSGRQGAPEAAKALRVFRTNLTASTWWLDWLSFRDESVAQKLDYAASKVKEVVDVPVVVGEGSSISPFHIAWKRGASGIDGIVSRSRLLPSGGGAVRDAIGANGAARQSAKSLWCLASMEYSEGVGTGLANGAADGGRPSARETMEKSVEALSCGAKGIFVDYYAAAESTPQGVEPADDGELKALADLRRRVGAALDSLSGYGPALCYRLPPQRLEDSTFSFVPQEPLTPEDVEGGSAPGPVKGRWLVPAWRVPEDLSPLILAPQGLPSAREYLPLLVEALGQTNRPRAYVGTLELPQQMELLRKYFTGQVEVDSDGALVEILAPSASCEVLARTPSGGVWHLLEGTLEIVSKSARPWVAVEGGEAPLDEAGSLRIFDMGEPEKYYSAEEFGREFLGLP